MRGKYKHKLQFHTDEEVYDRNYFTITIQEASTSMVINFSEETGNELWVYLLGVAILEIKMYSDQDLGLLQELYGDPNQISENILIMPHYELYQYSSYNKQMEFIKSLTDSWKKIACELIISGISLEEALEVVEVLKEKY